MFISLGWITAIPIRERLSHGEAPNRILAHIFISTHLISCLYFKLGYTCSSSPEEAYITYLNKSTQHTEKSLLKSSRIASLSQGSTHCEIHSQARSSFNSASTVIIQGTHTGPRETPSSHIMIRD